MISKYVIGFFCAVFFAVILLTAGYQLSYRHVMDRQSARAAGRSSYYREHFR